MTPARFPHSDTPGSTLGCQLPRAYRRLLRPSSALDAKASTTCPSQLVTHTTNPTPAPNPGTRQAMHTQHTNTHTHTRDTPRRNTTHPRPITPRARTQQTNKHNKTTPPPPPPPTPPPPPPTTER